MAAWLTVEWLVVSRNVVNGSVMELFGDGLSVVCAIQHMAYPVVNRSAVIISVEPFVCELLGSWLSSSVKRSPESEIQPARGAFARRLSLPGERSRDSGSLEIRLT